MAGVLQELPVGSAVAIVRLRSLGDCVLTTPALSILKQARPDLRVGIVVEDRFAAVYQPSPDVDAVLEPSVSAIRRWSPGLCLNLHGGTRSITLTAASGARFRAGFSHFRAPAIYNVRIPRAQEVLGVNRTVHTAEHLASAMFYLGVQPLAIPRASLFLDRPLDAAAPYAVIHAVAATPEKTWRAEGFLSVAHHLRRDHRLEPVFIAGAGEDLSPFAEFRTVTGAPMQETKALLAGATLFVGNDSGPAHMAAAFGVPVVVLFGPSDRVVWAPWQVESRVLAGRDGDIRGIQNQEVIEAIDSVRVPQ
jgi:heptosyltransferase III